MYKYKSSDKCIAFDSSKTKKDLNGCLAKNDAGFKQFQKTEEKIQKHMKALNKNNSTLLKISNKTSYQRDLNNINKIKKSSNNSLSIDNGSVSSNSDSR